MPVLAKKISTNRQIIGRYKKSSLSRLHVTEFSLALVNVSTSCETTMFGVLLHSQGVIEER